MSSLGTITRGPRTNLRVTLQSGKIIQNSVAAHTFAEAVEDWGIDRVKALELTINGTPLISRQEHDRYTQQKVGGYYVMTHSSTHQKKQMLEDIARRLGTKIKVEVIP